MENISNTKLQYSIILPTCNRAEMVEDFLQSVAKQTVLPLEVVLVDQSDDQKTSDAFARWNPSGVLKKYVYQKTKSLIMARNTSLGACRDVDLIAFFDDDILLDRLFCEEIVKVFEEDKQSQYAGGMGTVSGRKYRFQPFQKFFLMPHEGSGRFLASGAPTFPHWKKEFCETEFLSGGCTFWRQKIIQQYRFDERLSGYGHGDDVDISYRVSRKYKLFLQPKALFSQRESPPGRDARRTYRRVWIQNMYYLAQKNKVSVPIYFWCVGGHCLRDLICLDFSSFYGDIEGTWNILRGQIDTVIGYREFKQGNRLGKGITHEEAIR